MYVIIISWFSDVYCWITVAPRKYGGQLVFEGFKRPGSSWLQEFVSEMTEFGSQSFTLVAGAVESAVREN